MKIYGFRLTLAVCLLLGMACASNALANSLGPNITIADQNGTGTAGSVGLEDDETEPSTIHSQQWDLEGFFLDGNVLSMVGGFDFANGVYYAPRSHTYTSGDIFLDIDNLLWDVNDLNSAAAWDQNGPSHLASNGTFTNSLGWDYAIRLNFGATNTYTVWKLTSNTLLLDTSDIPQSNPWRIADENDPTLTLVSGPLAFAFDTNLTDAQVGFSSSFGSGGTHYAVRGIDLGFLGQNTEFLAHFTMECGNDLLVGNSTTVPEPGTLLLLGVGLAGLAWRARRRV